MSKSIVTPKDLRDFALILQNNIDEFLSIKSAMDNKLNSYEWQDAVAAKFKSDFEQTKEPIDKLNTQMEEFIKYLDRKATVLEGEYLGNDASGVNYGTMGFAGGAIGLGGMFISSNNDEFGYDGSKSLYDRLVNKPKERNVIGKGMPTSMKATGNGLTEDTMNYSRKDFPKNKVDVSINADKSNANITSDNTLDAEITTKETATINDKKQNFEGSINYNDGDKGIKLGGQISHDNKGKIQSNSSAEINIGDVKTGMKSDGTKTVEYSNTNEDKLNNTKTSFVIGAENGPNGHKSQINASYMDESKSAQIKVENNKGTNQVEISGQANVSDTISMNAKYSKQDKGPAQGSVGFNYHKGDDGISANISKRESENPSGSLEYTKKIKTGKVKLHGHINDKGWDAGASASFPF